MKKVFSNGTPAQLHTFLSIYIELFTDIGCFFSSFCSLFGQVGRHGKVHGFVCVREGDKEVNERRIKSKGGGGVIAETTIDDADAFWPERVEN